MNRALVAGAASSVLVGSPVAFVEMASADTTSGWVYTLTTGPYPSSGWWADDCQQAYMETGSPPTEFSESYSAVDPGACSGGAPMAAGWIGVAVGAYHNGKNCGTSSWVYNSATTSLFLTSAQLCGGTGNYQAVADGVYWDELSGVWQYTSASAVESPVNSQ